MYFRYAISADLLKMEKTEINETTVMQSSN